MCFEAFLDHDIKDSHAADILFNQKLFFNKGLFQIKNVFESRTRQLGCVGLPKRCYKHPDACTGGFEKLHHFAIPWKNYGGDNCSGDVVEVELPNILDASNMFVTSYSPENFSCLVHLESIC